MTGRRGIAPCGHPGEHIIGQYVRCSVGCDDTPKEFPPLEGDEDPISWDDLVTPVVCYCPFCGSSKTAPFMGTCWHCWSCGSVFVKS